MNVSRVLVQGLAFLVLGFVLGLKAQTVAGTTCINGVEFVLYRHERDFFESTFFCDALGMSLARIGSDAEFDAVRSLRQRLKFGENFWVGKSKAVRLLK